LATILHIAAGLAAGRAFAPTWRSRTAFVALSLFPDADVVAFALGIPYEHQLGHRGFTHSLAFAVALGVAAALVSWGPRMWKAGVLVAITVASHGLFDMLTDGGLGVALWWPMDDARHFFGWRPIPVAPIGVGMWSERGLHVLLAELPAALPLLIYGLWPGRGRDGALSR